MSRNGCTDFACGRNVHEISQKLIIVSEREFSPDMYARNDEGFVEVIWLYSLNTYMK
jgi:hypothetical protein